MKEIFASGGGTQSAAITALIIQGRLPQPDVVVIVDTGYEKASTWQYLDSVIRPELGKIGLEVHRVPPTYKTVDLFGGKAKETALMPLWTTQVMGQKPGKLSGFCSGEWKVEPQKRYLREVLGIPTKEQKNWIGFSLDETRRAIRMMRSEEYQLGLVRFPLINDVPLKREQAIRLVEEMGWPTPPRSSCYMCPNMNDEEWSGLSEEELHLAAQIEATIQEIDPFAFLHSSGKPILEVDFSKTEEDESERACSSGQCFV